jgi:histidinol phosphatase-like PHP family hydrolase
MLQDLHSHTYYSFCGKDDPEEIVKAAIAGGIELFGICDHNYGVGFSTWGAYEAPIDVVPNRYDAVTLRRYYDHISLLKDKYAGKIKILSGIEVATDSERIKAPLPDDADISFFDYCLIESLAREDSTTGGDLFGFAKRCGTKSVGIAHTDMFSFIASRGEDPLSYFKRMAEESIFWEMNVSYDSIHGYREHQYMLDFFASEEQQAIVRESGVRLSVGFDGHRVEDYLPERIKYYCKKITELGIKLAFED